MESKRAILAVALSLLVLIIWTQFLTPKQAPPPPKEAQEQTVEKKTQDRTGTAPATETTTPAPATTPSAGQDTAATGETTTAQTPTTQRKSRTIEVVTDLATYSLSEAGALLIGLKVHGMKETSAQDSDLKELVRVGANPGTLELITKSGAIPGLENAVFQARTESQKLDARNGEKELAFSWVNKEGVEIRKIYTFRPGSYMVKLRAEIDNKSNRIIDDNIGIVLNTKHEPEEGGSYAFRGFGAYVDGSLTEKDLGDIKKENPVVAGKVSWGGYENSYFLQAVMPLSEESEATSGSLKAVILKGQAELKDPTVRVTYLGAPVKIQPGRQLNLEYETFFGPKRISLLNEAGHELAKSINMGWFDIIAKPFLYFLNFNYNVLGNFGLAIIVLTIVVKILFWPLTQKSYKSMKAMQALQPQMTKLREKFKNDKQRLNQEMMGLYKAHKVNPMGGCLPMVIQIPVFIALYRLLDYAIELRHTPFWLWIDDLSAPDRLFRFPFSIPFMEAPHGIPVLTLLMGASMFITQKMTPTPGDPTQAKIMLLMPIVFTFIFINFPSGLVLYWLTQNVLSIGQQYWVNKKK